MNYFIDRIKFNLTKSNPASQETLLSFIAELYQEKIVSDSKRDAENKVLLQFDEILCNFMKEKFKLKKVVKRKSETIILAIINYSCKILIIFSI